MIFIIKQKLKLNQNIKRILLISLSFPIISLIIISSPDDLFINYALLGISERFLPPFFFFLINSLVSYLSGVGFFFSGTVHGCLTSEGYNGRLLILSSLFFLHIWILLFLFSASVLASLLCIFLSLLFVIIAIGVLARSGGISFFSSLFLAVWSLSLLFLNLGVLFI